MPDTSELQQLIRTWLGYLMANPTADDFSRAAGYNAGLKVCAEQLAETIDRMRADA